MFRGRRIQENVYIKHRLSKIRNKNNDSVWYITSLNKSNFKEKMRRKFIF